MIKTMQRKEHLVGAIADQLRPRFPIINENTRQRPGRFIVWLAIIALWAISWGEGTIRAALAIFNARPVPAPITHWGTAVERVSGNLFEAFCVIVLTLLLIKYYAGVSLTDAGLTRKSSRTPHAASFTVALYLLLLLGTQSLSDLLGQVIPVLGTPWYEDSQQTVTTAQDSVVHLSNSFSAGAEEVLFTAGIITLLSAAGYKATTAWAAAIILRTSFHIYYFPAMFWVLLWAAGTIYIYQRFGCVWTMLLIHILIDVRIDLDKLWPGSGTALVLAIAIPWVVALLVGLVRKPKKDRDVLTTL